MEYRYKGHLVEELYKDYRIKEGMKACMNCGVCTAVCPAAEFYKYNPKNIVNIVARKNEEELEELLKSDTIWYCGECMSCVTRCPRANAPGLVIMSLRKLSMKSGLYMLSEKGRQQYIVVKDLCSNILSYGYCVYPRTFDYETHKEETCALFVEFGFVLDSSPLWGGSALIFLLLLLRWSQVIQVFCGF